MSIIHLVNCCKVISETFKPLFSQPITLSLSLLSFCISVTCTPSLFTNPNWCLQFQPYLGYFFKSLKWKYTPLTSITYTLFFRIHTFIFSYANSLVKKFSPPVISVKHLYYFKVNNKHCLPNNFFPSIQSTHALTLLITIAISLGFLTVFSSMTANTSHAGWFPIISARQPRPPVLPGNHLTGKKSTWLQHEQLETLQLLRPSQPCTVAEVSSQSHHNEAYYWE